MFLAGSEAIDTSKQPNSIHYNKDSMVMGTDSSDPDCIWYVSKDSPKHLASSKKVFVNYKHLEGMDSQTDSNIIGIGEGLVCANNCNFIIPYVSYAPDLGVNVLSVSQLEMQGLVVEYLEDRCMIKKMFEKKVFETIESSGLGCETKRFSKEDLEELERNVGINISKQMIADYIAKTCNIGSDVSKGFNGKKYKNEMKIPSDLLNMIGFIDQMLSGKFVIEVKNCFANSFEKMVIWFVKDVLKENFEKAMPPRVGIKEVCLMDVYRTIKEFGGATSVFENGDWDNVAMRIGFDGSYGKDFENCYINYLQQLDLYYIVGKRLMEETDSEKLK